MVSVIVPFYNEEKTLSENLSNFRDLSEYSEVIFVDGASSDKGPEIASELGKLCRSERGRAVQMNQGAFQASGDILFFLHADATISPGVIKAIEEAIQQDGVAGGCLTQRIDKNGPAFRFIERFGNTRAKVTKVFYGDQGIFVRKDVFSKIGGFPEVSMMEDVLFTRKLRKCGKTDVLAEKITVSARRWEKEGIMKSVVRYSLFNVLFRIGVPLEKIKIFYDDIR